MRTRLTPALALCVSILCFSAHRVEAAPITFSFSGTVDAVDAPLGGTFSVGQALNGSYTFDSGMAGVSYFPNEADYERIDSYLFTLGGYSAGEFGHGGINVVNSGSDTYTLYVGNFAGAPVAGLDPLSFRIILEGDSSLFASVALPIVPPDLGALSSRQFLIRFRHGSTGAAYAVTGTISSLALVTTPPQPIPEPATLTLLGLGPAATGAIGRRRRRG